MIRAACTACGKQFQFADAYAGRSAKCPSCGGAIAIPALADVPVGVEVPPPAPRVLQTSGMAVAALCLGIAALATCDLLFPLAIVGLILGIVAIHKIDNPANGLKGRGLAQAGAIVSGVALVLIIPLLIAIMLPALGAARRTARQMQNSTQIRNIGQAEIMYAQGNGNWYAGLTKTGALAPPASGSWSAAAPGVGSNGMAMLLNGNFVISIFLVAPGEPNKAIVPLLGSGVVTMNHYSYAVPRVTDSPGDRGRHDEWKDNSNTFAPVLSDRVLDGGAEPSGGGVDGVPAARQRSIWSSTDGDWRGVIVFGDDHTEFSVTSDFRQTKYGSTMNSPDNLFLNDGSDPSANALQVRN